MINMNCINHELLELPFDLYTRNKLISIITYLLHDTEGLRILDVGGRNGNLLGFLQACDELYILDMRRTEYNEKNYITGNIISAPFEDDMFDLVISSDLYEHITPEDRINSLLEMLRISKNYVILGAPFFSGENEKAELEANKFFSKITGAPHPWLEEHIMNTLPKKDNLERFLIENNYDFFVVNTNNILNWYFLQYFIFYSYNYCLPVDKINAVYRFYNENFFELGDFSEPTYRKIYIIGKKGTLPQNKLQELNLTSYKLNVIKYQELISLIFDGLRAIPESKDVHIHNLESQISDLKGTAPSLEQIVWDKNEHIHNLESQISDLKGSTSSLEQIILDKNEHIHNLESQISDLIGTAPSLEQIILDKDEHIHNIESQISDLKGTASSLEQIVWDKDGHIHNLESQISDLKGTASSLEQIILDKDEHIQNLDGQISQINRSFAFQLLAGYHGFLEKILPMGTKRRSAYDMGIIAHRVIVNEGWSSFWFKTRRRLSQKIPLMRINSEALLIETNMLDIGGHIPLSLDKGLSGEFHFPSDGLNEIRILTATHRRINSDLTLYIRSSLNGTIIRKANVAGKAILDNDYTSFRLKPIKESAGKTFFFELRSRAEPHASVWYNPKMNLNGVLLYREGAKLNGCINLKIFSNIKLNDIYNLWQLKNEPSGKGMSAYLNEIISLNYKPKISIIMPVWNTDEKWLRLALDSVLNQIYVTWELCIADGNSDKPHITKILEEYASKDPRIKVRFLPDNKGIAGNSNEALSLATGEFVAFLDHDDELAPFALSEVVKLLNENSELDYIYSDEDKIDEMGQRRDPFFKVDWSPDMFLSCNYLCHLSVIRKSIMDDVGGFRRGYDGSQDYDLFLRVTERIGDSHIAHIPRILYHWRIIPESAASSCEAKSYAYLAAKKALKDAMIRRGIGIDEVSEGFCKGIDYRIKYKIMGSPKVSIIIPTKDNVDILKTCIDSIINNTEYDNYEIVIVDNQSEENITYLYYEDLKKYPKIKILNYNHPFNFSSINNYAVSKAESEYILFLNNDVEVISSGWLSAMLEYVQRGDVGAVGAKLLYPNGTIQHAGVILGIGGVAGHSHKCFPAFHPGYFARIQMVQNLSAVTAACMMTKKSVFEEVGGFDEKNLSVAFNDIDYCLKLIINGYLIVYTPYAELYHHESLSRGYEDTPEKKERFIKEVAYMRMKWGDVLDNDPYYNPNLSRDKEDFSIKI